MCLLAPHPSLILNVCGTWMQRSMESGWGEARLDVAIPHGSADSAPEERLECAPLGCMPEICVDVVDLHCCLNAWLLYLCSSALRSLSTLKIRNSDLISVPLSLTRFLLVVLSIYRQIHMQAAPVLSDTGEDNFDRAFSKAGWPSYSDRTFAAGRTTQIRTVKPW
ncbi:FAD/NAD(P)-binding domain-containing protein [Mycena venus]|uniref:FAD/NAD(P)-binding domain-containing protein n=1 Tax=Mycena venus TaxID=2733690 RepID=A0A8H6XWX9_9AGAR|nr:FAD/NAD(P)-binding domain-containing protein [Mycena venus]